MGSISVSTVHELCIRDEKFLAEPGFEPGPLGEKHKCNLCPCSPLSGNKLTELLVSKKQCRDQLSAACICDAV